jgi:hypothetical protein
MENYGYEDFVKLFNISDRGKARKDWFGFKVAESGVRAINIGRLSTPSGKDMFSNEELYNGREEAVWSPLIELKIPKRCTPAPKMLPLSRDIVASVIEQARQGDRLKIWCNRTDTPTPKALPLSRPIPPSRRSINMVKKRIEQWREPTIIPASPPMRPAWARNIKSGEVLLEFPCTEKKLKTFIRRTGLDFMLPPDHELLQPTTNGSTCFKTVSGCSQVIDKDDDRYWHTNDRLERYFKADIVSIKKWAKDHHITIYKNTAGENCMLKDDAKELETLHIKYERH